MSKHVLRARWVVPIEGEPIEGGYVSIADGIVLRIDQRDPGDGPATDLGDVVLLPQLVNAHTHLEFSSLAKPLGARGMSLPNWIRSVIGDRGRADRNADSAIAAGLQESRDYGVAAVGEIATSPAGSYGDGGGSPHAILFQEVIGFSAGRVDSVLAELERRVDAAGNIAGVSPHAPYTVHPQLFKRLIDLAVDRRLPAAMHLAESREELQLLTSGAGPFRELLEERSMWDERSIPHGTRPLEYLRELSRVHRGLIIHGNYLDDEEINFAAAHREQLSVVYCPRTHAYFEHEPYPLEAMLAAGVRVALGTDSRASTPDLDLLKEVQLVADRSPRVAPSSILRMATIDAAAALGIEQAFGSIAPGKRAHLATSPCNASAVSDPYDAIVTPGTTLTPLTID